MLLTDRLSVNLQPAGNSFPDRLIIWLHVAFVIFTIGPVTIAILSTPRYIRTRNVAVLRYMLRTTRIFGIASLGVLAFGIAAAQELHKLSSPWVTTAMTLFVVSLVLLVLIMRDQRRAVVTLETASETEALATANNAPAGDGQDGHEDAPDAQALPVSPTPRAPQAASLEHGRVASLAGIVTLLWLVILVLMVWNS